MVNLYIGDNISYIGHCAFGHCANLEEVTLSENVASIQHNAFKESLNLRTIYCRSKNPPSVAVFITIEQPKLIRNIRV
ncbi:leucine-rich repeat protein [Bacteroides faecis]|uniref:leucine-rich repeat protein n=1 Tax=Bacteroides faecis TaxID=674529 RepID=UPI0039C1611F